MKTLLAIQIVHAAMHIVAHLHTLVHSLGHLVK